MLFLGLAYQTKLNKKVFENKNNFVFSGSSDSEQHSLQWYTSDQQIQDKSSQYKFILYIKS